MAGLRFAFVCEDTLRDILERLEHTKVLGLGAGARTGGRRPGAHPSRGLCGKLHRISGFSANGFGQRRGRRSGAKVRPTGRSFRL